MSDPTTPIKLSFPERDLALLTFDDPQKGANVLSQSVLEEFSRHLDTLEKRQGLEGLVICSGKPGMFIAGADLREFAAAKNVTPEFTREMCTRGRKLFQRLSRMPFVTVAAIDGVCLGGGAELALWCDRRLITANPKAQFGLPEVKLGLFPGWGGTARLPRIVGLSNAVELICGGEPIDGRAAVAMGLTSDIPASDRLQAAAIALVRQEQATGAYKADRGRWSGSIDISDTELTFLGATGSAYIQQQTKGQYPAPLAALEVMLGAAHADIDAACEMEAEGMSQLFGTPINRALINVFFLTDRNKKDMGVDRTDLKPKPVKSLSVFGAGIMGSAIAAVCVKRGVSVSITDVAPAGLQKAVPTILEEVSYNKALKGPDVKKALELAPLINATVSDSELAASDLLLEAVVENEKIKKELFARLEPQIKDETILATNTSTIPITRLAAGLKRPERFCGIHFFNPVRKMPLVEVIRGEKTSDQTVVTAVGFAKAIGKSPIVVYDGPGFLVNRVLFPYLQEALELITDGVQIEQIERCAKKFGMPMGPITLYDVIGLDTAFYAGSVMYEAFPDRCAASPLMVAMVKANRLGQKSGVGFYSYKDNKERGKPDPTLQPILEQVVRKRDKLSDEQVTHRLFLPMLLEATRILEEKKVRDPRDVDLGLIFGIGFPPHKGGLLFWADHVGAAKILEWLKPLAEFGARMRPTEILKEMARTGQKFYSAG